jgi:hypothetical protein
MRVWYLFVATIGDTTRRYYYGWKKRGKLHRAVPTDGSEMSMRSHVITRPHGEHQIIIGEEKGSRSRRNEDDTNYDCGVIIVMCHG